MGNLDKAYKEIFGVMRKHKDIICFDYDQLERKSKIHLFATDLKEKYGLDINVSDVNSCDYFRVDDHRFIGHYGKKYGRIISWSDDDNQPEDEILIEISFPTGAYIFSPDYPKELFNEFFEELKSFNPKYSDSNNHCLYFSLESGKEVFNSFNDILKKYREKAKKNLNAWNIKKLKEKLSDLEAQQKKLMGEILS